ncbi:MAG TPA: peptidylprolyl isomerase [Labilithrix sp.]|nr:peptidylprolyl isomerase [Labilithrix sp.]
MLVRYLAPLLAGAAVLSACSPSSSTPETTSNGTPTDDGGNLETADADDADASAQNPLPGCPLDPGPPTIEVDPAAASDPTGGAEKFTIAQALAGYPESTGVLTALITTQKGTIRCELDETAAPISVANFVGLARGTRPFKASGKWKVGRFFDGLLWHRVIPDFVIQGGDPRGTGTGGPGYDLVDENHVEEPLGTLAMAAAQVPSGSQFFIVVGNGPAANYNVFGKCETETAIAIAAVPRNASDKPTTPVHMQRIDIARCPK